MPAPTNTSFATATDLGTLPATATQRVDDSGTTYTVYYSFTAPTGAVVVGALGFGDVSVYTPTTKPYTGPAGSPVSVLGINAVNRPMQFPVTAGTQYFLEVVPNPANPTPANLTLNVQVAANDAVPVGAIAVNDDTVGFPLAYIGTDGSNLRFVNGFPAGEGGDTLANGVLCVEDINLGGIQLYSSSLTPVTSVTTLRRSPIRANVSGTFFYTAYKGFTVTDASVVTVSATGVVGSTVYTLTGQTDVTGIGASPDDTILYFAVGNDTVIQRWDLVNNVALSNLAALGTNEHIGGLRDVIVVLDDGSVVVSAHNSSTLAQFCKRFNAAGTLLNTYSFGTDAIDRLATSPTAGNFWVWLQPDGVTDVFKEVQASDGTIVQTVSNPEFENGEYTGAAAASPPRFGHSNSCPFWINRVPIGSATTTTTYPIRRVRQTAHLSTDQLWQFFGNFQLDIQAGVGLTTGQGSDPVAMLSWSDDGGHTWSQERWLTFGKIGEYKKRAMLRGSIGRSRDRVWRVVISDPVPVRILQAMVGVEKGLS